MMSVALVAMLAACSNGAAPNAANNAAPANAATNTTAAPAGPSTPGVGTVSGAFTVDGKPTTLTVAGAYRGSPIDGKPTIVILFTTGAQPATTDPTFDPMDGKFGPDLVELTINPDGAFQDLAVYSHLFKSHVVTQSGGITIKNFSSAGGTLSGEMTNNGPDDVFGQKVTIDLTFKVAPPT
jgi:hypothetical protein